jgi:hypothetical protein
MQLRTKKLIAREFLVALGCVLVSLLYFIGTLIFNYRLDSQREDILNEIETKTHLADSLTISLRQKLDRQEHFYKEIESRDLDEEYIRALYDQLGGMDKFGVYDEFREFISTNKEYRKHFYSTIGEKTLGKFSGFESLVTKVAFVKGAKVKTEGGFENFEQLWAQLSHLYKTDSIVYKWDNDWNNDLKDLLGEIGFKDSKAFNSFIEKNSLSDDESKSESRIKKLKEEINSLIEKSNKIEDGQLDSGDKVESTSIFLLITGILAFPIRYFIYAIFWSYRTLNQKE